MSRIMITGAAGFIGRRLVSSLCVRHELVALVRPKTPIEKLAGVHWLEHDLSQPLDQERFPERVDAIIHLAQSRHYRNFPEKSKDIFDVNIRSTFQLLEYARNAQAKTFVLASSGGIYGHGDEGFREDEPITAKDDLGFYLGTKLCSEVLAESFTSYMNVIILRFFFVYGAGQRTTMLIPRLVKAVKEKQPIILHGKDGLKMNPTYITDAASAVCRSLELTVGQKINIAGPEVLSLRKMGQHIGEALRKEPVFEVQEAIEPRHLMANIKKMSQFLGSPQVGFKEGIKKYIEGMQNG